MNDCVFCDTNKIKARIIASLDGVNMFVTLGQITEGYVLLIPTNHVPCLGALTIYQIMTLAGITNRLVACQKQKYQKPVTIFEHGIVGQTIKHAHLHLFPADIDLTNRIRSDFPNSETQVIGDLISLHKQYQMRQEPYLLCSIPSGGFLICWNPPAQPQYLRIISAEMLGVSERADWKQMDPEVDKALIEKTIRALSPNFN